MPKIDFYRCLQFGVNSDVLFRENSDVITLKLNICQKWNICQEWDICDMPTGNIYRCLYFRTNNDVYLEKIAM